MSTHVTVDQFLVECGTVIARRPAGIRGGQAAFNLLADLRPDLANRLAGTPADPFEDNSSIPAFFQWLVAHWDDPACPECGGAGVTLQGHTDKNGYDEPQYGLCRLKCAASKDRPWLTGLPVSEES